MKNIQGRPLRRCRTFAGLFILAFTISTFAAETREPLSIAFDEKTVTVRGAGANHQVILFGIGIGNYGRADLLTREALALADEDGDGVVTFSVRHTPPRAVWFAIDFEDGTYVVATADGQPPAQLVLPADSWRRDRAYVDVGRPWLETLVVRRGVGAWTLRIGDGGSNDADGLHNRVSRMRLDRMERLIGEEKGPPFTIPTDLVVLVDPNVLDCFVDEVR